MFKVFYINFQYFASQEFPTFEGAVAYARKTGFEATIVKDKESVAFYSPLNGLRIYEIFKTN